MKCISDVELQGRVVMWRCNVAMKNGEIKSNKSPKISENGGSSCIDQYQAHHHEPCKDSCRLRGGCINQSTQSRFTHFVCSMTMDLDHLVAGDEDHTEDL